MLYMFTGANPNYSVDLWRNMVVLMVFFIEIYGVLYVFGILSIRHTHSQHSKYVLIYMDHQEAQEGSKSGSLEECGSLDGLFHSNIWGVVWFWNPWH